MGMLRTYGNAASMAQPAKRRRTGFEYKRNYKRDCIKCGEQYSTNEAIETKLAKYTNQGGTCKPCRDKKLAASKSELEQAKRNLSKRRANIKKRY